MSQRGLDEAHGSPRGVRLHQLEGFFEVATHQGFTRAAATMPYPITEAAFHQQVRKLERALGVPLLVRGEGRRMVLTPEGRLLHDFVTPFFDGLPGLLRALSVGMAGTLVVGTEPLYAEGLCAEAFAILARRSPRARLRLLELDVADIEAGLLRGRLDVGVASVSVVAGGVEFEELGRLGLRLLVPASHPLARRRPPLLPRQIAGHRFILYVRGTKAREFTEATLSQAGISVATAAEASSAASMGALVRAGLAPAFVPAMAARGLPQRRELPDGIVAFDLTHGLEKVAGLPRFGVLRRAGAPPVGLVAAFTDAARSIAGTAAARQGTRSRTPKG